MLSDKLRVLNALDHLQIAVYFFDGLAVTPRTHSISQISKDNLMFKDIFSMTLENAISEFLLFI